MTPVNYFLLSNLQGSWDPRYPFDRPLPLSYLKKIMEDRIPKDLHKKQRLIWEKRIKIIHEAYAYYICTVCDYNPERGVDTYFSQINSYVEALSNWSLCKYNYSLHL